MVTYNYTALDYVYCNMCNHVAQLYNYRRYNYQSDLVPVLGSDRQLQVTHTLGCYALEGPLELLEQVMHLIECRLENTYNII